MNSIYSMYDIYKSILFCTDFSANADFALDFAIEVAKRRKDSTLYILHINPYPEYTNGVSGRAKKEQEMNKKIEETYLNRLKEVPHYEIIFKMASSPYLEILDFINEKKCDIVILGRHGETGWAKTIVGSTAEKVMRKAMCPILIIPERFKEIVTKLG
ncbi:MAG: universal stress protein [Syntrophorhabdaceae bacterium]|nr:universal stress protein [Syntrophorhabdaceae bacterium]MDD5244693.1 universal stress protein [Syntrophorhabdaceae bacterium]